MYDVMLKKLNGIILVDTLKITVLLEPMGYNGVTDKSLNILYNN